MKNVDSVEIPVSCDCGANFHVPIGGLELENIEFSCPKCGRSDKFTDEQIEQMVAQHETVAQAVSETVKKAGK